MQCKTLRVWVYVGGCASLHEIVQQIEAGLNATGNVDAQGQNALASSLISAAANGSDQSVSSLQMGQADGRGDTLVQSSGGAVMSNFGFNSPYSSDKSVGTAGATGSIQSMASILTRQELTWENILVQVLGSAEASGIGHAQANLDLGAGNVNNGIEINGLVSGVNAGGGIVNAEVKGNGQMDGTEHNLNANMLGNVNGANGNSTLVGATNIQSNTTNRNTSVSSFGDSKIHTDGSSAINMRAESNLGHETGNEGKVGTNATVEGTNKHMTVQNGLNIQDNHGQTIALGNGFVFGNGTENSNASMNVDTKYGPDGVAQVAVDGEGQAVSTGKNSSLTIGGDASISNAYEGLALSSGVAHGEMNGMKGNTSLIANSATGSNGTAAMEAWGGGAGDSSVQTNVGLIQQLLNELRNITVNGGVAASGDRTQVSSFSFVNDVNGAIAGNWYKFSTSNKRTSAEPHWSRYRLCAKLPNNLGKVSAGEPAAYARRVGNLIIAQTGNEGKVGTNATAEGTNKHMTVQNGLNIQDSHGQTIALGNGFLFGNGTENSNASMNVDTKYGPDGIAQVAVDGEGQAVSTGKNSSLTIVMPVSRIITVKGLALSSGIAHGEMNGMKGNTSLTANSATGSNGTAAMEAWGGGVGDSSVQTNVGLIQQLLNELRNITVDGGVAASGDRTQVSSFSFVNDVNVALGNGFVFGNGTENSNASMNVDTKHSPNGIAQVAVDGEGEAVSTDKNSSLTIGGDASISSSYEGLALASGIAHGEMNGMKGNTSLTANSATGSNGMEAAMEAWGGGVGDSSVRTNVNLIQQLLNELRNITINGGVAASGDRTQVSSFSFVNDINEGLALSSGTAHGEMNGMKGNTSLVANSAMGSNGTAAMEAWGGGVDDSSVQTNVGLIQQLLNELRNITVNGSVAASGDRTLVSSFSFVNDVNGAIAGNWYKFSTSNKRTSAEPHWSRYRLCAKLLTNLGKVDPEGLALSSGTAHGEMNGMKGNTSLVANSAMGSNGTAAMEAWGGGVDDSSVQTNVGLIQQLLNELRNITVNGSVAASGDRTLVSSFSFVNDVNGAIAGNWYKFSTSNKRTSAEPHWSRYRLCAKLLTNLGKVDPEGLALSSGVAHGEMNGLKGNTSLIPNSATGSNGTAAMEAWGGGVGDSSVQKNVGLIQQLLNELRNITVNGGVAASGDRTQVSSFSFVNDVNGAIAGNWYKFSTSNKRTSAEPHWSRYRLCAKLPANLGKVVPEERVADAILRPRHGPQRDKSRSSRSQLARFPFIAVDRCRFLVGIAKYTLQK
ncbi:unnamed protein product [Cylicocyclus nassatus]|uniref:Uncharacterized protein n=1 Tax=Cylicocyclus nassatus TaxID=53992 RepID=A0AA36GXD3_CYLNA|nr:unnamed protein product [Cylicocyclus nassatus]